jgi:hypothetical protein
MLGAGASAAGLFSAFGDQNLWGRMGSGAPRGQTRWSPAVDVVDDPVDDVGIGDVPDDPQQSGLRLISISKTRFRRCAQVSGAAGGSLQSFRDSVGELGGIGGAAADSSSFLRRRPFGGVGTIARRMGELGAKTPW